eukprot:CAMPEP_0119042322 /NCGR_PEP_ID=MMETSP1177-20130426/14542_1 /TAXON_ID=2985 /ORGANISM="Ochromonas sp, Strain CCMP1899" /LENGTH=603 /DNA_ID=CAMNT_0007009011 /DNA_START=107 /DNA_END=1915 /DNA_ORIENTATION=-
MVFRGLLLFSLILKSSSFVPSHVRALSGRQLYSEKVGEVSAPPSPPISGGEKPFNPLGEERAAPVLTQKEYLISVRNRLFSVEEQIWLHEHAIGKPKGLQKSSLSPARLESLLKNRADLLDEYPLTKLYADLKEAQERNMTYAVMYIERLINTFDRQLPVTLQHINQIAVVSYPGEVINLMRGQGSVHHRLVASTPTIDRGLKRQFQQPVFSLSGKYVAMAEMHVKEAGNAIVRSNALVFDVPQDPKVFGAKDSMPIFDSLDLPGIPLFIRFSPDDESLVMLCATADDKTSLLSMTWGKYAGKKAVGGQAAMARFAPRKVETLMTGKDIFFTYTTSNQRNSTIIAHSQMESKQDEFVTVSEKAVWLYQKENDEWSQISKSNKDDKWSTPICHSAGGGDSVLVVEDGWLVSKAISRFKRDGEGQLMSKKIMEVKGEVHFQVAPDNSRAVVLQEDISAGHYSLMVIEGEDALDPSNPSMGVQYELPNPKLTVSFYFSPDSSKLLCLAAAGKTKEDVMTQRGQFRVALNSEMQYTVFNFPLQELREYDSFKPTPYFMKTYVPFSSQYAQVYNPWSPDSQSFIYVTSAGMFHTPLVGSRHCLGEDRW